MINFKKGPALSLGQSDKVAKVASNSGIEAGHLVRIDATTGLVTKGASATPNDDLLGFAINDATAGDVLESGKMGMFLLDGGSVIETDKAASTITSSNYPVGAPVKANTDGEIAIATPGTDRVIGYVEGIRNLPSVEVVNGVKIQGTRAMLGIKLSV